MQGGAPPVTEFDYVEWQFAEINIRRKFWQRLLKLTENLPCRHPVSSSSNKCFTQAAPSRSSHVGCYVKKFYPGISNKYGSAKFPDHCANDWGTKGHIQSPGKDSPWIWNCRQGMRVQESGHSFRVMQYCGWLEPCPAKTGPASPFQRLWNEIIREQADEY